MHRLNKPNMCRVGQNHIYRGVGWKVQKLTVGSGGLTV